MANLRGLHHVQLAVPPGSETECRRFWGTILGCAEIPKPAALAGRGGCWFRAGSLELHLGVESEFRPSARAHPGILVDDIRSAARRLEDHGVSVAWDDGFEGFDRFYCHDPFGNRLEFLEPATPNRKASSPPLD